MNTNAINGLNTPGNSVLSGSSASFGDNPFLNLLIAEMRTQTPLDPVDNSDFMQQMSSFSSMSEQKQLNDNLLQLLEFQGALARMQGLSEGSNLLGKEVTFDVEGVEQAGTVESVFVNEEGEVRLTLSGEREIGLRDISAIQLPGDGA